MPDHPHDPPDREAAEDSPDRATHPEPCSTCHDQSTPTHPCPDCRSSERGRRAAYQSGALRAYRRREQHQAQEPNRPDPPATSPLALLAALTEHFDRIGDTVARDLAERLTARVERSDPSDDPSDPSDVEDPSDDVHDLCLMRGCQRRIAGTRYHATGIDWRSSSLVFCPAHARQTWPDRPRHDPHIRPRHTRRPKDATLSRDQHDDPRDPRDPRD